MQRGEVLRSVVVICRAPGTASFLILWRPGTLSVAVVLACRNGHVASLDF